MPRKRKAQRSAIQRILVQRMLGKGRKKKIPNVPKQEEKKSVLFHTVYYPNGDEYKGQWLDGKKHGLGTNVWKKSGMKYDGDWEYGKRSGNGNISKQIPETEEYVMLYTGEWRNNQKDGSGTYFYSKSSYYEGEWSKDERSGWGRMFYENRDLYEGEWLRDKPHGHGILLLANENRYEGNWKDGMKHGPGKFYFQSKGQLYEGMWIEDIPKCGTVVDFGRDKAPDPTMYPIPEVYLINLNAVLLEAQTNLLLKEERDNKSDTEELSQKC